MPRVLKKSAKRATKSRPRKTAAPKAKAPKPRPAKTRAPDFSGFPSGSITEFRTHLCLACIFDVFTSQFGLSPRTAYSSVRTHTPAVQELTAAAPTRPYFRTEETNPHCPYCQSTSRWLARLDTHRIEGGKPTDEARRQLVKSLPKGGEQFQILEEKSNRRAMFFEWLETMGRTLDLENEAWLLQVVRVFLEKKQPKTNWAEVFAGVRSVRRSQRLEEGWEVDAARLFLAPALYNEALLVQYLVSRSHRHGGRTFEGRLTLMELVRRLRHSGYLNAQGITEYDPFDVLEKLVERLVGGSDETVKLYYIVDRRDLLDKVKVVYAKY